MSFQTYAVDETLVQILATKRPTKDPIHNRVFMSNLLTSLSIPHSIDGHNNLTVVVGDSSMTCFTSHTDTVDNKLGVNELEIFTTQNSTYIAVKNGGILGADCGSGIYIMLKMIQAKVPGLYVFFSTEEQGRVGSMKYDMPEHILRCISFDRKDTNNLITHQMSERGCSREFAAAFIESFSLPYVEDPTGSFTDSYSFFDTVPECVNLSVGYYNQHSKEEHQDLLFLERLVKACIAMDWESLPTARDPSVQEFDYYEGLGFRGHGQWSGYYKQPTHISTGYRDLLDFCEMEPDCVTAFLEAYGFDLETLTDFQKDWYER